MLSILSSLFGSPVLKNSKEAAKAAGIIRKQASDKLFIEAQMLIDRYNLADSHRNKLYSIGKLSIIDSHIGSLVEAEELINEFQRYTKFALEELADLHAQAVRENSSTAYDAVQVAELKIKDSFMSFAAEIDKSSSALFNLLWESGRYFKEEGVSP